VGAGAFFALSRSRARSEKKSAKAGRKKSAKKSKSAERERKKKANSRFFLNPKFMFCLSFYVFPLCSAFPVLPVTFLPVLAFMF
jgi:hypothetical protein